MIEEMPELKPTNGTNHDPVPSHRSVISESEILQQVCLKCKAGELMPCRNAQRQPLAFELNSTELRFHAERIMAALHKQVAIKLEGFLQVHDRSLIIYYAFVMLADACAANSEKLFSKKYSSEDLQAFFASNAVTELKKDRLIGR